MKSKALLISGSIFMALAVAFGAFGAHIVQDILTPERFEVYKTAVEYHFYHALGLLIIGAISNHLIESVWLKWAGRLMSAGILIFSGSLYILTLTDTEWLGAITPFGGIAFILGWIFFAVAASTESKNKPLH
ncbi:DUF423 domain-containing protein [Rhodohalobacter halophilus]|uniref:DUF423 domain-containing protein n=1 Tax=Rhodohalobacter halophilus TaxID=1812810 RepID=UPI00083FA977|nr:DUF423 domain-containing protein [Rhodohalobacter halophilus]